MTEGEEEGFTRKAGKDNKTQENRKGRRRRNEAQGEEDGYSLEAKEDNKAKGNHNRKTHGEDGAGGGRKEYKED